GEECEPRSRGRRGDGKEIKPDQSPGVRLAWKNSGRFRRGRAQAIFNEAKCEVRGQLICVLSGGRSQCITFIPSRLGLWLTHDFHLKLNSEDCLWSIKVWPHYFYPWLF